MTTTRLMWQSIAARVACAAILVIALPGLAPAVDDPEPELEPPILDHFLCYRAAQEVGRFHPVAGVEIVDRFGTSVVELRGPEQLCTPANKEDEDPLAPMHLEHLEGYEIRSHDPVPTESERYVDQFGDLELTVQSRVSVLTISHVSLEATPSPPPFDTVDDFQCYSVRVTGPDQDRFRNGPMVEIEDRFGTIEVEIRRPRRVCLPADKGDDPGAENHQKHLLCYDVRVASRPQFETRVPVTTTNLFSGVGGDIPILRVRKPAQLCVPATRTVQ